MRFLVALLPYVFAAIAGILMAIVGLWYFGCSNDAAFLGFAITFVLILVFSPYEVLYVDDDDDE